MLSTKQMTESLKHFDNAIRTIEEYDLNVDRSENVAREILWLASISTLQKDTPQDNISNFFLKVIDPRSPTRAK